ncbi:hypothetical protein AVEN_132180-1 [Araneus ventricosus]|uniref:Uncharacterized protein n=1 Tax=Araneus ventricosus TaxID=182803 RepID=A0A4Y2P311_ARAVE|nr:hypothetical protein AVEN_132180-1 [Araneus ventricosus]
MRKLNIIVWCLDRKVLSVIYGIIHNPPHTRAYDTLESKIIEFFSQSESAQLKLVLSDKLSTQLLVELQNLSTRKLIDVWRTFWQQRLPIYVQQILSICKESLGELAMVADIFVKYPIFKRYQKFVKSKTLYQSRHCVTKFRFSALSKTDSLTNKQETRFAGEEIEVHNLQVKPLKT